MLPAHDGGIVPPFVSQTVGMITNLVSWMGGEACPVKKMPDPASVVHFRDIRLEDPCPNMLGLRVRVAAMLAVEGSNVQHTI